MKINGLQAEIENEGEFVILKLKMHTTNFVKFYSDCGKVKKSRIPKVLIINHMHHEMFSPPPLLSNNFCYIIYHRSETIQYVYKFFQKNCMISD